MDEWLDPIQYGQLGVERDAPPGRGRTGDQFGRRCQRFGGQKQAKPQTSAHLARWRALRPIAPQRAGQRKKPVSKAGPFMPRSCVAVCDLVEGRRRPHP